MMDQHQRIAEFQKHVQALEEKARKISPNLFLFDEYRPKQIPPGVADDEVIFWYLIVDLYGLFFDAGRYLCSNDFLEWDQTCRKKVNAFYDALNEIRSVFCHNKPPTSYLFFLVTNSDLEQLVPGWRTQSQTAISLITRDFKTKSPFKELFDIFLLAADEMLKLTDTKILSRFAQYANECNDEAIYMQWFVPIFKWFWNNSTVYTRAWQCFCRNNTNGCSNRSVNSAPVEKRVAKGAKAIQKRLYNKLSRQGLYGEIDNYGYNMYHSHFSPKTATASRRMLTPFNLFKPLLQELDSNTIPTELFANPVNNDSADRKI